jgi:flagellar hook-length control protein FliK
MVTAINTTCVVAPAPAAPAAAAADAEPGAFARELDRAAQAGDPGNDVAETAEASDQAPASSPAGTSTSARAKARAAADSKVPDHKAVRAPEQREDGGTEISTQRDKNSRGEADTTAPSDLQTLLAGLMAPSTSPTRTPAGSAEARPSRTEAAEAAQAAQAAAGGGRAPGMPGAAQTLAQAADGAMAAAALPAFTLAQASSAPAAPAEAAAPAPVHQAQVSAAVGTPEFAPGLSAEVTVMLRDGLQEARLQLNPAEMGPITVQIRIEGDNARINLSAEQAPTRDALEQALPTLAGTLRDNGLTLTGGGVFEQPRPPRDDSPPPSASNANGGREAASAAPTGVIGGARQLAPRGVVDLYA